MHIHLDSKPEEYNKYVSKKISYLVIGALILVMLFFLSISLGAVNISFTDVIKSLFNLGVPKRTFLIIWNIRVPQTLTAITAGVGLAVAGVVLQSVLNNPLGSPFTLGISNAAAFGAAFSVMILGTGAMQSTAGDAVTINNHYATTAVSFSFCVLTAFVIFIISKIKKVSSEVMVLTGVALGSLFTAGTMFLQYFADDVQLSAMVFWTFGDVSRAGWRELLIMVVVSVASLLYYLFNSWNYNAIGIGDETAKGLGINVEFVRLVSMLLTTVVTAVIISFLGIIGFIGLICPHMARRIVGDDHRFLIPASALIGGILLTAADLASRTMMLPHILPVAVVTSFLGAPLFIYLLVRGYRR
jgi:iron complex transport system permease protein